MAIWGAVHEYVLCWKRELARESTYLDDLSSAERFARRNRIVRATPIVQLLPLLLEMVHCFLLLLPGGRRVEANEVSCRIQAEALRTVLWVNPDEDHRYVMVSAVEDGNASDTHRYPMVSWPHAACTPG